MKDIAPDIRGSLFLVSRMNNAKPNSLGKGERLKSRKGIDLLFVSGKKITLFPFRILYRLEPGSGEIRAGFTVSSKNFPRAVDRNRIKRLTREAYRLQNTLLKKRIGDNRKLLELFIIYTGRELLNSAEMSGQLKKILEKLVRHIDEEVATNT